MCIRDSFGPDLDFGKALDNPFVGVFLRVVGHRHGLGRQVDGVSVYMGVKQMFTACLFFFRAFCPKREINCLLSEMMRCKCVCIFADEIKGLLAARNLHPFAICIEHLLQYLPV